MNNKLHSLKLKVWAMSFILIAVIIMMSIFILKSSYDNMLWKVSKETVTNSYLVSQWIKDSFNVPKLILQQLTTSTKPEELVYPTNNSSLHEKKTELIKDLSKLNDMILFLGLYDKNCVITHTSIGVNLGRDLKSYPYCKKVFEEPLLKLKTSNMSISSTNKMNVTVTYPVMKGENIIEGFGLIGLDLYFFQQWLDEIVSNNISKELAISVFDLNKMHLGRVPLVKSAIGKQLDNAVLDNFIKSKDISEMTRREVSPIDGIDRMWTFRKIKELPFVIVVGLPITSVIDDWKHELIYFIITNIIFIILIIYTAYKFIQNQNLAVTDKLTGVYNRTKLEDILHKELKRSERFNHTTGLIIIDIDYFKQVNDTFGHQVGDDVLCNFAKLLNESCRLIDTVGRWGGEEFILICPETNRAGIIKCAETLRKKIEDHSFPTVGQKTASFGLTVSKSDDDIKSYLKRADDALYEAKTTGRNKVCFCL